MGDPESRQPPRKRSSRLGATVKALIRARVTAGLLVVLPIWVTYLLVRFIFKAMRDASQWAVLGLLENPWVQIHITKLAIKREATFDVDRFLREHPYLDWGLALVSVLLTVLFLYAIGVLTANLFGRRIIEGIETLVGKVPLVKSVYRASKQIATALTGGQPQKFRRVAMFPFLSPGVYSFGFVTNVFRDAHTGEEYVTIFYSTTPNPTTGFVFVLPRNRIVELDWSIEQAASTIMSGGILLPETIPVPTSMRWREPAPPQGESPGPSSPPPAGEKD